MLPKPLIFTTTKAADQLDIDAVTLIDPAAVVYAADGAGRCSGRLTAAATQGVDEALVAAAACLTAWGDKRPLLVLNVAETEEQSLLERVYAPVVARSLRADSADNAVREAVVSAALDGPVQLLVPPAAYRRVMDATSRLLSQGSKQGEPRAGTGDDAEQAGGEAARAGEETARPGGEVTQASVKNIPDRAGQPTVKPRPADVARVAELFEEAQRPAIICGGGAERSGGVPAAMALADHIGAPLLLTMAGSCLSIDNARAVAKQTQSLSLVPVLTPLGSGPAFQKVAAEADVVLTLGVGFSEVDGFGLSSFHPWSRKAQVVSVSLGDEKSPPFLGPYTRICADARAFAESLDAFVKPPRTSRRWTSAVATMASKWRERFTNEARRELPLPGGLVAHTVLERSPSRSVFVSEGSGSGVWIGAYLFADGPRPFVFPAQEATIGVTLPMAVGAAAAEPESTAVGLIGDGAALYHIQELATAARLGLPVVLVLFNNRGWNLIRAGQTYAFSGRHVGVNLPDLDYAAMARGYGCLGIRVRTAAGLERALEEAFAASGPALIDVEVDPDATPYMGLLYALCEFDGVFRSILPDTVASGAAMVRRRKLEPRLAERMRFIAQYLRGGRIL